MDYHDNLELLLTILDSVIENLTLVLKLWKDMATR